MLPRGEPFQRLPGAASTDERVWHTSRDMTFERFILRGMVLSALTGCGVSVRPIGGDARADVTSVDGVVAPADAGFVVDPSIGVPRAVVPSNTSRVSTARPELRWVFGARSDGAIVELSRTRDFARVERLERVDAFGYRPREPLGPGVWFWRLRALDRGRNAVGSETSPVWWFRVTAGSRVTGTSTHWGTELDVNGDGYADVAVAANGAAPGVGRVELFFGGPEGLPARPSATLEPIESGEGFGFSLASAGDVNGDGYGDLIVGSPRFSSRGRSNVGAASIYFGGPGGMSIDRRQRLEGSFEGGFFGYSVASAGDVNSDGYADVIVGAPEATVGGLASAGVAAVFLGGAMGLRAAPLLTFEGSAAAQRLGASVASAGDVNGDGFADVLIGAPRAASSGRSEAGIAQVALGMPDGLEMILHRTFEGASESAFFGSSVASAGDVNGDGYADVIVGAPGFDGMARRRAGGATVYLGGPPGLASTPHRSYRDLSDGDGFGFVVAGAGDLNGDGFSDVIVATPFASQRGRRQAGSVSVYFGSASGLGEFRTLEIEGLAGGDRFGASAAGAGDVNGDVYADLIVGAPGAAARANREAGLARLYYGFAMSVGFMQSTLEGRARDDRLGLAVAGGAL